ncbi:putative ABC1 protein At2g40090 [Bidens hawaiensis]|uniref:putative ABC1 protein At2g40090 n=1 Tax=Bidens hawaiensis TaxID=980011 RepID=UPI004048FFBA
MSQFELKICLGVFYIGIAPHGLVLPADTGSYWLSPARISVPIPSCFVQHMHMTDYATVELIVNTLHWIFPSFDYRGRRKPQLVLLDHGLYKKLDVSTRTNYAALWKADAKGIKENCMKLGAGEDLYALFAGILTMRPWNRVIDPAVDHLAIQGNDHSERQMYASQYFPQITVLLHKLPRVILLMLKTNDCLRSVNNALIQRPSVESFIIIGRVSSEALIEEKLSHVSSLFTYLFVCFEQISLEARFFIMQVALWMLQFRTAFS